MTPNPTSRSRRTKEWPLQVWMPAFTTGELSGGEDGKHEQDPENEQLLLLQEELRKIDDCHNGQDGGHVGTSKSTG